MEGGKALGHGPTLLSRILVSWILVLPCVFLCFGVLRSQASGRSRSGASQWAPEALPAHAPALLGSCAVPELWGRLSVCTHPAFFRLGTLISRNSRVPGTKLPAPSVQLYGMGPFVNLPALGPRPLPGGLGTFTYLCRMHPL